MGAWGSGSFENDDAADWVYQYENDGVVAIESALQTVCELAGDDYLEAPEALEAVAAAEIVAAMQDSDLSRLSEEARKAFAKHQSAQADSSLSGNARSAVERVLHGSELKELWEESDEGSTWTQAMKSLLSRLG